MEGNRLTVLTRAESASLIVLHSGAKALWCLGGSFFSFVFAASFCFLTSSFPILADEAAEPGDPRRGRETTDR